MVIPVVDTRARKIISYTTTVHLGLYFFEFEFSVLSISITYVLINFCPIILPSIYSSHCNREITIWWYYNLFFLYSYDSYKSTPNRAIQCHFLLQGKGSKTGQEIELRTENKREWVLRINTRKMERKIWILSTCEHVRTIWYQYLYKSKFILSIIYIHVCAHARARILSIQLIKYNCQ